MKTVCLFLAVLTVCLAVVLLVKQPGSVLLNWLNQTFHGHKTKIFKTTRIKPKKVFYLSPWKLALDLK